MKEAYERILVVDDSAETLELVQRHLQAEGYRVSSASGVVEAIRLLDEQPVDLVVTDLKMPKVSGLDLVRHVRENLKDTEVMMITGYASIEGAVTAVKLGAEEYLAKPFTREELLAAVERALDALRVRRASAAIEEPASVLGLVGESDAVRRLQGMILREAGRSAPVLLVGEAGTGKETAARAIHYGSPRAGRPFLIFRAGAVPPERLETELFGDLRRATGGSVGGGSLGGGSVGGGSVGDGSVGGGSVGDDPVGDGSAGGPDFVGFLRLAEGGTLYLDDVERLPVPLQERLLREGPPEGALESGRRRRGEREDGVRLIASTGHDPGRLFEHRKLAALMHEAFEGSALHLPPLRERGEDILLLARHFLLRQARDAGVSAPRFSDRALAAMREYHWPGNVGELETVVGTLANAVEGGLIDVPDLPSLMRFSALRGGGTHRSLAEVELQHIQGVLAAVGGNKTKAAEILGIDRKTLREKLKSAGETAA